MADLLASQSSKREALTVAHRLTAWRLPPGLAAGSAAQEAAFMAPPLAPWAAALGSNGSGRLVGASQPIR